MTILVTDGDDTLWPAPIDADLVPVAIIAKYLGSEEPKHPVAAKTYRHVIPRRDSLVGKWLAEHSDIARNPKTVYENMTDDGSLKSRNALMREEGVYDMFMAEVEQVPFSFLYRNELSERRQPIKMVLEQFERCYLWTAATKRRAETSLEAIGVLDIVTILVTDEDNLPKSDVANFSVIEGRIPGKKVFLDDSVPYILNAQRVGWTVFHAGELADPSHERICVSRQLPCIKRLTDLPLITKSI